MGWGYGRQGGAGVRLGTRHPPHPRPSPLTHPPARRPAAGSVLNYGCVAEYTPAELAAHAARVLRFVDLGGHERYSKTALLGLTCTLPDYVMLCVCAARGARRGAEGGWGGGDCRVGGCVARPWCCPGPLLSLTHTHHTHAHAGISWVTRDHLAVALALGVPTFVVLTRSDLAPPGAVPSVRASHLRACCCYCRERGSWWRMVLTHTNTSTTTTLPLALQLLEELRALAAAAAGAAGGMSAAGAAPETLAPLIDSKEEATTAAACMLRGGPPGAQQPPLLLPVLVASSVTGAGLSLLHAFLNALPVPDPSTPGGAQGWRQACAAASAGRASAGPAHFQIDGSWRGEALGGAGGCSPCLARPLASMCQPACLPPCAHNEPAQPSALPCVQC